METEPAMECVRETEECPADLGSEDSAVGGTEGGVDPEVGEPYCFESDQVALKNNPDYQRLLRTVCVLEAQRSRAISDLEQLYLAQEKVLQDPIRYVDRLQRTGSLGLSLPGRQTLAELPRLDWKKYTTSVDFKAFGSHRQSARLKHQTTDAEDDQLQRLKSRLEGDAEPGEATGAEGYVRGRFKDESKSATFNKLWTPAEQRRLDELLIQFPPEEVEARRWRKIANAFGDRTPQQIASRVQKYFLKLEKNSLPVPGRVPTRVVQRVRKAGQRHHHHRHRAERDSTFLHKYQAPVWMKEDWDDNSCLPMGDLPSLSSASSSSASLPAEGADCMDRGDHQEDKADRVAEQSDEEDEDLRDTAEFRELVQLKKLREEKLQTLHPSTPLHHGYKCDRCEGEPIVGVRWHCVDCPSTTSLDFCDTCYLDMGSFDTPGHNSSHRLRPIRRTWNKVDQDYSYRDNNPTKGYNYLDPNFMPAL